MGQNFLVWSFIDVARWD